MDADSDDVLFVEDVVNIEFIKREQPAPKIPETLAESIARSISSASDSGTGRSSRENHDPVEDIDDCVITKGTSDFPAISLKNYAREANRQKRNGVAFPRYEQLGGAQTGSADTDPANNWKRKDPSPKSPEMPRPVSRFTVAPIKQRVQRQPQPRMSLPAKMAPEYHGSTAMDTGLDGPVQPSTQNRTFFKRNMMDIGRSISAPPDRQPPWARHLDSPAPTEDEETLDEATVRIASRASVRPEDRQSPAESRTTQRRPEPPKNNKTTVVIRANFLNAVVELETFCNLHQIKMDGGVRLTAGPSGNEHIAEIDVPDRKYAEELVKEYDGKVLPGTASRLRCFIKGRVMPVSSQFRGNAETRKRTYDHVSVSHEELNRQLDEYKRNGQERLKEERRDSY